MREFAASMIFFCFRFLLSILQYYYIKLKYQLLFDDEKNERKIQNQTLCHAKQNLKSILTCLL